MLRNWHVVTGKQADRRMDTVCVLAIQILVKKRKRLFIHTDG